MRKYAHWANGGLPIAKRIVYGEEFRQQLLRGMNRLADAVAPTLGPGGGPEAIDRRVQELRYLARHADYGFNHSRYQERLSKFVSGVAKIQVGGLTELELTERKFRVEDAVAAARAAWEEGVVPPTASAPQQ